MGHIRLCKRAYVWDKWVCVNFRVLKCTPRRTTNMSRCARKNVAQKLTKLCLKTEPQIIYVKREDIGGHIYRRVRREGQKEATGPEAVDTLTYILRRDRLLGEYIDVQHSVENRGYIEVEI